MLEFVIMFGVFAVGFVVGWYQRERYAKKVVEQLMGDLTKNLDEATEEIKDSFIPIKIEKHSDTYYVFNSDTDEFMGQAADKVTLEKELAKRFPGKRFTATASNLTEMGFQ